MRGRHAKPSGAVRTAAAVAPAAAITSAVLGVPQHHQPPPSGQVVQQAEPAELASSVTADAPVSHAPRTYVVQLGDTLSGLAQRFYGNDLMWPRIWHANMGQVSNPDEIYPGQRLTIPGAFPRAGTEAVSSSAVSSSASTPLPGVPSVAAHYIEQAAKAIGLPVKVVAAQNYTESSYGENMGPSSAGAMGPWQFMPGTWPSYSRAPFSEAVSWPVSTQAYIKMMKQLLHWSGGDVRMALAAYNAGPGNWQAGLGYADQILAMAYR